MMSSDVGKLWAGWPARVARVGCLVVALVVAAAWFAGGVWWGLGTLVAGWLVLGWLTCSAKVQLQHAVWRAYVAAVHQVAGRPRDTAGIARAFALGRDYAALVGREYVEADLVADVTAAQEAAGFPHGNLTAGPSPDTLRQVAPPGRHGP